MTFEYRVADSLTSERLAEAAEAWGGQGFELVTCFLAFPGEKATGVYPLYSAVFKRTKRWWS